MSEISDDAVRELAGDIAAAPPHYYVAYARRILEAEAGCQRDRIAFIERAEADATAAEQHWLKAAAERDELRDRLKQAVEAMTKIRTAFHAWALIGKIDAEPTPYATREEQIERYMAIVDALQDGSTIIIAESVLASSPRP